MSDTTVTWTILHRNADNAFSTPLITGMVDAHSYDHAETEFEILNPNQCILGIYEGDVSRQDAIDRYNEENFS